MLRRTDRIGSAKVKVLDASRRGRARAPLVLIVDDDADARASHAEILRQRGFRTAEAADGEAGIEMALAARPDVILMDCAMPGMSGTEAAERLKSDTRTSAIPIVMLTGFAPSALTRESSRDCDACITKPSTVDAIAETLRSVLVRGAKTAGSSCRSPSIVVSSVRGFSPSGRTDNR